MRQHGSKVQVRKIVSLELELLTLTVSPLSPHFTCRMIDLAHTRLWNNMTQMITWKKKLVLLDVDTVYWTETHLIWVDFPHLFVLILLTFYGVVVRERSTFSSGFLSRIRGQPVWAGLYAVVRSEKWDISFQICVATHQKTKRGLNLSNIQSKWCTDLSTELRTFYNFYFRGYSAALYPLCILTLLNILDKFLGYERSEVRYLDFT